MDSYYIIKDWTGNICFHGKKFETFEEAWDFIHLEDPLPAEADDDLDAHYYDDYYVTEVTRTYFVTLETEDEINFNWADGEITLEGFLALIDQWGGILRGITKTPTKGINRYYGEALEGYDLETGAEIWGPVWLDLEEAN